MMSASTFVKNIIGEKKKTVKSEGPYLAKNEDWRFSVARVMLNGLLKNQYYRSKDDASKEALQLFKTAAKKDPEFLLKAAAFARSGHTKGMVLLALAALSAIAKDKFLDENRDNITGVLSTFGPNQLLQFVELVKSKELGRGFGARPQKWVAKVMESWSPKLLETHTLKYGSTIKTLLRLVHPSFRDVRGKLVRYVLDESKHNPSYGKSNPSGRRQKAVEKLKNKNPRPATVAKTMIEYEIPWDVVKGFYAGYNTGDVGLATLTQMGLNALLLNLRSLDQGGIFNDSNGLKALELKLDEVKNGRAIPLDFAKPYLHSTNEKVKTRLVNAIVDTLSYSMPAIEARKIGLSIDVSGSMQGEPLLTAGLMAVPFLQAKNLWFTTFSDVVHEENSVYDSYWGRRAGKACPQITGVKAKDQVNALLNLKVVGGTNLSAPIVVATKQRRKLDLMVLITDEHQNRGVAISTAWNEYKRRVNPRAELWIINASNTNLHAKGFENDPSVTVYQTMTPAIFQNLKFLGQDLVSAIEEFDLDKIRKVKPANLS